MVGAISRGRGAREAGREGNRVTVEGLLARATYLPEEERVLFEQSVEGGLTEERLALLHRVGVHVLRRKLGRIRKRLNDPSFLLAATLVERIPEGMRGVARGYFVEGRTLRECAAREGITLHGVRQTVTLVRSVLLLAGMEGRGKRVGLEVGFEAEIARARRVELREEEGEGGSL